MAATATMICTTGGHALPEGAGGPHAEDMALFLDADLSILVGAPEVFDAYEVRARDNLRRSLQSAV